MVIAMEWFPIIVSLLGTTSVSAVITALLVPRTEARRLHNEISELKKSLIDAPPGSKKELLRALDGTGYRLSALSFVRFRPTVTVVAGSCGLALVAATGAFAAIASASGITYGLQHNVAELLQVDPIGYWALVAGVVLAAVAVGIAIAFFRFMLLRTARAKYVRAHLMSLACSKNAEDAVGLQQPELESKENGKMRQNRGNSFGWLYQKIHDLFFVID